jgi:hypothetical protein
LIAASAGAQRQARTASPKADNRYSTPQCLDARRQAARIRRRRAHRDAHIQIQRNLRHETRIKKLLRTAAGNTLDRIVDDSCRRGIF